MFVNGCGGGLGWTCCFVIREQFSKMHSACSARRALLRFTPREGKQVRNLSTTTESWQKCSDAVYFPHAGTTCHVSAVAVSSAVAWNSLSRSRSCCQKKEFNSENYIIYFFF